MLDLSDIPKTIDEVRNSFINYYKNKKYIKQDSAPIIPSNDPSVLFTTAGMQQFKSFYSQPNLTNHHSVVTIQPVVRTSDIAEVGDETHLTMFEMLGNFRFGLHSSYEMKETAIDEAWEFITKVLEVSEDRIHVTIFEGDKETPADTETERIWQKLGVRIEKAGREDNFWGPTGNEGPCGPNTEIFIDNVEVWNLVFNQYYKQKETYLVTHDIKKSIRPEKSKYVQTMFVGLDTGSGLERLSAVIQNEKSVWNIEPYSSWVESIDHEDQFEARIIADHLKAIIFLISAGVVPGNKGRDYVLRRLLRKVIFLSSRLSTAFNWLPILNKIHSYYSHHYTLLPMSDVWVVVEKERQLFEKNLSKATRYLERWLGKNEDKSERAVTELAFYMYESFGFPKELVLEHLVSQGMSVDVKHFEELFRKHQEISRGGSVQKFKGGLADHNKQTIKHHTAHHLLLAALRQVLGSGVVQKGSNVTSERLRIDFSFDRKVEKTELKKIERIVNGKIKENLDVVKKEMSHDAAIKSGALAEFGRKYGGMVSVYSISSFSKELCGGPHVKNTKELGEFKILKEEASSQGIRRIKAKLS